MTTSPWPDSKILKAALKGIAPMSKVDGVDYLVKAVRSSRPWIFYVVSGIDGPNSYGACTGCLQAEAPGPSPDGTTLLLEEFLHHFYKKHSGCVVQVREPKQDEEAKSEPLQPLTLTPTQISNS